MALLPPETTDRIIDFLHNNRKALYACCLVCREWVPSSRTHLFRTIDIESRNCQNAFLRLMEFSPQVGLYVRVLMVDCDGPLSDPQRLVYLCLLLKNLSKLDITVRSMRSGAIVALWSSLPGLKEISLKISEDFHPGDIPLITIPNKIQSLDIVTRSPNKWFIPRNFFPQIRSCKLTCLNEWNLNKKKEYVISLSKFLKEYCLNLVHVSLDGLGTTRSEQLFDCLGLLVNLQDLFVGVCGLPITTSQTSNDRYRWRISDIPRFLDCITSRSLMSISWGIEFDDEFSELYDWHIDHNIDFDIPGFTQMWEGVCRMLVAPRFNTVKTVGLRVGDYLFDNRWKHFSPLLAFGKNGHVNLLWVGPYASGDYWGRMLELVRDI